MWGTINKAFFEVRIFPDLKVIFLWLFISLCAIYVPFLNTSPIRTLFALPVILFIPGYSLIAAFFPQKSDLDLIERIALSFGMSIAVVPLIGLALNYTPWGIRLDPIVISLSAFVLAMILIGQYRRGILPDEERYEFPFSQIIESVRDDFFSDGQTRFDRILSIILLISIITAISVTIFVIAVPKEGEKFTEFFILGENQMAADYPSKVFVGVQYPLFIGVGNHEYRNITYTIETHVMNMTFNPEDNTSTIMAMDLIDKDTLTIPHNETITRPYTFIPPGTGYNRIEFLLFNESVPNETIKNMDRINASYRDLHLWTQIYPAEKR
ncbi:hypothetical protein DLD82_13470 [Methanospirillum stamsii]|uniref:DUF1616 domain-containing protein n=1 Tax=Methanospirillum stamsii TaxID=1277351 RepID=A0A2V2N879_9EURY|nr:hypothetical protein DLD82_13470 [Methanospirillum stamsii]